MTSVPRYRAWDAIHDALPDGWAVAPASCDPGRRAWTVVARSAPRAGRYGPPEYIEAQGEDETAALTYLALALEERRGDERRVGIGQRARMAYVEGAEAEALRSRGRGSRARSWSGLLRNIRWSRNGPAEPERLGQCRLSCSALPALDMPGLVRLAGRTEGRVRPQPRYEPDPTTK